MQYSFFLVVSRSAKNNDQAPVESDKAPSGEIANEESDKQLDLAIKATLTPIEENNYTWRYSGRGQVLKMGLAIYLQADIKSAFEPDLRKSG
ncbi:MAG: hypothetical protein LBR11_12385 [Deltaproteobacteria bacterium]|nr:hypothetical protein [Deltaproteobacteria bacterium]